MREVTHGPCFAAGTYARAGQIGAILDEQGNVVEMEAVSGPHLLYQAAVEALKKWKYESTYLNDQPIAGQTILTISFTLGQ